MGSLQEADREFRYIALELCLGTLADYVDKKVECETPVPKLLEQAMSGLSHLHSLGFSKYIHTTCILISTMKCKQS